MIYLLLILAVVLSYVFVVLLKPQNPYGLRLLLAFSGSLLLSLTVFELLPRIYLDSDSKAIGIFILLGILFQIFLEFYSQGLEHGHEPHSSTERGSRLIIFISLCLHALLEGIPVKGNEPILWGILVHKIPVAIVLSIFLVNMKFSRLYSLGIILIFALMTPLGSMIAQNSTVLSDYAPQMTAFVIGVFLHISTIILFESSKGHQFNTRKLLVIILGIVIAYFI